MKVQQELLRHSDIRTKRNVHTRTVSPALREANSKVGRMIFAGKQREIHFKNAGAIRGHLQFRPKTTNDLR